MKNTTKHFSYLILLTGLLPLSVLSTPCDKMAESTASVVAKQDQAPEEFLEFSSELDGKCQNLSAGGKLRVVKNNHPDKIINYRFYRMFSGKRQAGITVGRIEPGGDPVKLGCTKVDGREQTWEIKVAKFTE